MAKRLMAKVGEYQRDGQTKGRYVEIGVIMSNQNGEYAMLSPSVDLAGVLMQQRITAQANGGKVGDRVMCSIFDDDRQQGGRSNGGGGYDAGPQGGRPDLSDEIPF